MKVAFRNTASRPHVYFIEPFGEDYTLLPGQQFALQVDGEGAWIQVDHHGGQTSIHLEGKFEDFSVMEGDRRLECGHQRQSGA